MKNHFGLAFSLEQITFAHFLREDQRFILQNLGQIEYPFTPTETNFLQEENIVRLANTIKNKLESLQIKEAVVSISLETNFAVLRRIPLPPDLSDKEATEQIGWELSQTLLKPLKEYVFIRTNNILETDGYAETLVIAIEKPFVDFYQSLVSFAGIKLNNLSINQLAAEVCLKHVAGFRKKGLDCLFKFSANHFESIFVWNGEFHSSNFEYWDLSRIAGPPNGLILEKITDKVKYIETLFEHKFRNETKVDRVYIYGSAVSNDLIEFIQKNFSAPVKRLNPLLNLKTSEIVKETYGDSVEVSNFIECIGVALDV